MSGHLLGGSGTIFASPSYSGYLRLKGPAYAPDAVAWWYVGKLGDGLRFARGGRVRTSRLARRAIESARHEHARDIRALEQRPTHRLDRTGNLVPL